jgi:mono/diheme cytochrome c family protein
MSREIEARGLARPTFQKGELVDLSAYIRSASRASARERHYQSPGNPRRGEEVLGEKECLRCHSLNGEGGSLAADFAELQWDYSVTEIAGLMWNHGGEMAQQMGRLGMEWPSFSGREMADLISFLYFLGFTDRPGDAAAGRQLFLGKGCAYCHGGGDQNRRQGPDLTRTRPLTSASDMAQILWNHAPVMEAKIAEKVINWPQFAGTEMADLYTYLQSLAPAGSRQR